MVSRSGQVDEVFPKRKDRVTDREVADETNRVHRHDATARKRVV